MEPTFRLWSNQARPARTSGCAGLSAITRSITRAPGHRPRPQTVLAELGVAGVTHRNAILASSVNLLDNSAGDATAPGAIAGISGIVIGVGRVTVRIRQRVNNQRRAIAVEDTEIAVRQCDAAGYMGHEAIALRVGADVDQVARMIRVVRSDRKVMAIRTQIEMTAGSGACWSACGNLVNVDGVFSRCKVPHA